MTANAKTAAVRPINPPSDHDPGVRHGFRAEAWNWIVVTTNSGSILRYIHTFILLVSMCGCIYWNIKEILFVLTWRSVYFSFTSSVKCKWWKYFLIFLMIICRLHPIKLVCRKVRTEIHITYFQWRHLNSKQL